MVSEVQTAETAPLVAWLDQATRGLEHNPDLDPLTRAVGGAARPFNEDGVAGLLRGEWLGHALHPLLTDLPLGCWTASIILDFMPGGARASRRLIGVGLAAVPLTAAAGLAEWDTLEDQRVKRVAAVHAIGNTVAALAFGRSWMRRRGGRKLGGMGWSLLGGSIALATGYLGGHLSFARRAGTGARGIPAEAATPRPIPTSV